MTRRFSGFLLASISALLIFAPTGAAQTMGSSVPGAITVTGEGSASAPAEEAMVMITIGTDGSAFYDPATGMPIEVAEQQLINATPIVDAMVAFGMPVKDISVEESPFTGDWGSGMPPLPVMIMATIPNPTVEGLSGLLEAVRSAAKSEGVFVNQFSVMYTVADCRTLEQQARVNAVADAALQADDQAAALNTTVGEVVASRDVLPMNMVPYQPNGCSSAAPAAKPYSSMYMASPFDPRMPAEVTVNVAVEVSYALP